MKKPDQPERRQYKRFKKHFILTYWDLGDPHVRHEATQLKNLSLGGICLVTAKSYAPMTTLCIELKTPFYSELTRLEAKVVQSNEKIKDVIYETHMVFEHLSPNAQFALSKIIEHFENQEPQHDE